MSQADPWISRLAPTYRFLAYQTFNSLVLLFAVNVILAAVFFIYDHAGTRADPRVVSYRERFADYAAYTRLSKAEADAYLQEQDAFGSLGFPYAPWVQFRNPEFGGRLLNTDKRGFRRTRKPSRSGQDPFKVYIFGGSTTFGYGVPDEYTIPSYVQQQLELKDPSRSILVKNFGQGFYYSSQEQLVLLALLKEGDIPDWAVFIDGGNDVAQLALRHDEPIFTPALKRLWGGQGNQPGQGAPRWIPMVRLAQGLAHRLRPTPTNSAEPQADQHPSIMSDANLSQGEKDAIFNYVVARYLSNMRITRGVCQEFRIRCLFVWQPHPAYKYDRALHKTFPFPGEIPAHHHRVYAYMETLKSPDFLFLGDLTDGVTRKVYVDDVHYNEATNEEIALKISDTITVK
jgi:lysophospholipase L1-like esterase